MEIYQDITLRFTFRNRVGASIPCTTESWVLAETKYPWGDPKKTTQFTLHLSDSKGLQILLMSINLPPEVTSWYIDKCRKNKEMCVDLTDDHLDVIQADYLLTQAEKSATQTKHSAKEAKHAVTKHATPKPDELTAYKGPTLGNSPVLDILPLEPAPEGRSVTSKKTPSYCEIPHSGYP